MARERVLPRWVPLACALAAACVEPSAWAAPAPPAPEATEVTEARKEFMKGTELRARAAWSEALAAYERSAALRPHAATTYDIGLCHRAMGNYTLARKLMVRALAESEAANGELAPSVVSDAKGILAEIDGLLATASITLKPASASVAVDGRPLEPSDASKLSYVAGVRAPGPAELAPGPSFRVVLNPGVHVFVFARQGFADAVVNKTLTPRSNVDLNLELDRLPAILHVASTQTGSIVNVDDTDVGMAPVEVNRPAGSYRVLVRKAGYKPYETRVVVRPGEAINLSATLVEDRPSITKRWWFWSAAAVVVAGAAVGTYFITRTEPTPTRSPLDGGGLGWAVSLSK